MVIDSRIVYSYSNSSTGVLCRWDKHTGTSTRSGANASTYSSANAGANASTNSRADTGTHSGTSANSGTNANIIDTGNTPYPGGT